MFNPKTVLTVFLFLFLPLPLFAALPGEAPSAPAEAVASESNAPPPAVSADSIYAFPDHLFSAEAVTGTDRGEVSGEWKQDHFTFVGLGPKAEIRLEASPHPENGTSLIEFNPLPGVRRRLVFYDSAVGGKLVLYYSLNQEKQTKENNYMTLTLWAGRNLVKRLRLTASPKNTWQKEVVNLGVVSFLNRPVPMTYELGSDSSGLLVFKFLAEIKR